MPRLQHTDLTNQVSDTWIQMSTQKRIDSISSVLNSDPNYLHIEVLQVQDNGHVTLRVEQNIPADVRGIFFLDLEETLKQRIDMGITIWLDPVGDKSKLRQLRGVEIRS